MDTYQTMAQSVLNYLSDHQYCSSLINANKRCFEEHRVYLEEKNISYSPEAALEWYLKTWVQLPQASPNRALVIKIVTHQQASHPQQAVGFLFCSPTDLLVRQTLKDTIYWVTVL